MTSNPAAKRTVKKLAPLAVRLLPSYASGDIHD